jgi:hypothetical protein
MIKSKILDALAHHKLVKMLASSHRFSRGFTDQDLETVRQRLAHLTKIGCIYVTPQERRAFKHLSKSRDTSSKP